MSRIPGSRPLRSGCQGRLLLEAPPTPAVNTNTSDAAGSKKPAIQSASDSPAASGRGSSMPSEYANTSACSSTPHDQSDDIADEKLAIVYEQDQEEEVVHLTGKRSKRCTSEVWNYFTKKKEIVEVNGQKFEQIWGYCNFPNCKQRYRAEGNRGTTGFKNHLRSAHSIVKGQQQLQVGKYLGNDITDIQPYKYDQEVSLRKFYLAITMHEYPFSIIEHEYFVDFIKSLQPSFPIECGVTVSKKVIEKYLEEKWKLYKHLNTVQSRFSATMDMWTSWQNKSYMCVTVHWINEDWHIEKRIIGFFSVKGWNVDQKLAETFTEVMLRWNLENKLFSLTLDNDSANEVEVKDIISDMKENGQASLVLDGLFFHVRCACRILNLVARDGMKVFSETIDKIKALVVAVKGCPLQWKELMKCATESGLDTKKGISLDVSTRWDSTYLMLRDALYYKDAFIRLKSSDRRRYEEISPSPAEWNMALNIFQCLKKLYDLTEILSGTSYPTANLFYRGFCGIKVLLDDWCHSEDMTIRKMAIIMSAKFEKYWEKSNLALAVSAFLDPRYKKKIVEFFMRKFYGDGYQIQLDEFVNVIKNLYNFYATNTKSTTPGTSNTTDILMGNVCDELESYLNDTHETALDPLNELDKYMARPLLRAGVEFDILAWWKNKTEEYPILSQIVRDVMSVQVSTVAPESAFSVASRVVDPYRSHLDPEVVEALICTKDWVAAARKDSKVVGSIVSDLEVEALSTAMVQCSFEDGVDSMNNMTY